MRNSVSREILAVTDDYHEWGSAGYEMCSTVCTCLIRKKLFLLKVVCKCVSASFDRQRKNVKNVI